MDRYWDRKLLPILEMPDAKIEIAKKILQTLSVAAGPLNFEAFCESIAVSADGVSLNSRNHMFSDPNDLLELCPGLIEFSAVDADGPEPEQCPNLVHPSVREYLFSGRIETTTSFVTEFGMNEDQANSDMAQTCLTYLLQFKGDESRIGNVVENYNFLSYAATFWNIHVKKIKCPLSPSLERLIIDFFTSEQSTLQTWLHAYDPDVEKQRLIRPTPFPSALYYASLLGYSGAVEALLEGGAKTNESCGKHNYPLLAAVEGGHVDVARMLIEHRADLEARYINKDPALVRAAQRGRIEIIAMLIEEGANVNAQDRQGKTPLRSAIIYVRQNSEDYEQILRLLLQAGATIDIKDQQVWTPLHWAVRCDREPMVQLLLDARADIEARDKNNQTPLHHAALFQEVEMRCLLAKGANIEVADRHGRTPLFEAAAQGFAIGVRLLLEHGADIHVRDENGRYCTSRVRMGSRSFCICSLSMDLMYRAKPVEKKQHCILRLGSITCQLCARSSNRTSISRRRTIKAGQRFT